MGQKQKARPEPGFLVESSAVQYLARTGAVLPQLK